MAARYRAHREKAQLSVDELRARLDARIKEKASFSAAVYQDEPILMTGRQMKSFLPDEIHAARQLAKSPQYRFSSTPAVFYAQAQLLQSYEDDFEQEETFSRYYPTYEDMTNAQLRAYFSWRTKVRRGNIERGQLSFAFVYLYELINGIGAGTPEEGYEQLCAFAKAYGKLESSRQFHQYLAAWKDDYVIYYGLDPSLLEQAVNQQEDRAVSALLHPAAHSSLALFSALETLNILEADELASRQAHEEAFQKVAVASYLGVAAHFDKHRKTSLADHLLGRPKLDRYQIFKGSVFANPLGTHDADYQIDQVNTFLCREGLWFHQHYDTANASNWISTLFECVDAIMREVWADVLPTVCPAMPKYVLTIIREAAKSVHAQEEEAKARAVHIDLGKLSSIRRAAETTAEKLIVDEEDGFAPLLAPEVAAASPETASQPESSAEDTPQESVADEVDVGNSASPLVTASVQEALTPASIPASAPVQEAPTSASPAAPGPAPEAPASANSGSPGGTSGEAVDADQDLLTAEERAFLSCLLAGEDATAFERDHHVMASILAESINEKLYDEFADIVIDASSGTSELIEDYIEDLRGLIGA